MTAQEAQAQLDTYAKQVGYPTYRAWQLAQKDCWQGTIPICGIPEWQARMDADLKAHGVVSAPYELADLADATSKWITLPGSKSNALLMGLGVVAFVSALLIKKGGK